MLWILGPVGAGNAIEAEVARGYDWRHHKMWGVEELTAYAPILIISCNCVSTALFFGHQRTWNPEKGKS